MADLDSNSFNKDNRRGEVPEQDKRNVTFVGRKLSPERLEALRSFLATASADDIAMIRQAYGDVPEVLQIIALELGRETAQE
jgi:hypothetical protein